jgi:UDP-N-acetylmuramoylalanine-D-glutamate ligase
LNGKKKDIEDLILNATVVMKSPGIPDKASIVKKLVEKGIVISEIEFAAPFTKSSYDSDRKQWKDDYNHVDLSFA